MVSHSQTFSDAMYALTVTDTSKWPDVRIEVLDSAGHFDVVICGWRCVDGSVYPPAELAAGAGWRDMLAELFLRKLADDSAFQSTEPDSE